MRVTGNVSRAGGQPRAGRAGGAALALVLMVLVVTSVLSVGMIAISGADALEAGQAVSQAQAFWAAEAGLAQAKAWGFKYQAPYEAIATLPLSWRGTTANASYGVTIYPDALNPVSGNRRYDIVCVATNRGGAVRAVRQHAQIETFASYMHASNFERMPDGTRIYFGTGDVIDGMLYVNDEINVYGTPRFLQLARSADNSVNYTSGGRAASFEGGLQLNAPRLDFNQFHDYVSDIQTRAGSGGLVLNGNSEITFNSNGTMSYRTYASGAWGTWRSVTLSAMNGAVYVNGSVQKLQGTLNGNVTIAAENSIGITNGLTYASAAGHDVFAAAFNPAVLDDSIGLIARQQVQVLGRATIQIHGAVLVTEGDAGFNAVNKYTRITPSPQIRLYGSVSQYRRGVVGRVGGDGFVKYYKYDTRFLSRPPAHFPYSLYAFTAWTQSK